MKEFQKRQSSLRKQQRQHQPLIMIQQLLFNIIFVVLMTRQSSSPIKCYAYAIPSPSSWGGVLRRHQAVVKPTIVQGRRIIRQGIFPIPTTEKTTTKTTAPFFIVNRLFNQGLFSIPRGGDDDKSNNDETTTSSISEFFRHIPLQPSLLLSPATLSSPHHPTLLLIDGFCPYHSGYLSRRARDIYGLSIINVLSSYLTGYLYQEERLTDHLTSRIASSEEEMEDWLKRLPKGIDIIGWYCESDSGLEEAERWGASFAKLENEKNFMGPHVVNPARRDKFLMIEEVTRAGLTATKQKLCTTMEEAVEFATKTLGVGRTTRRRSRRVVVKPHRGSGSDNVFFCSTPAEISLAFQKIRSSPVLGSTSKEKSSVLVQEYLRGTEYAVDIVSRDGEHKVAALWRYDKRMVNGAPVVYYKTELMDLEENNGGVGREVCDYARRVLDALSVTWGLSHSEIIVMDDDNDDEEDVLSSRCRLVEVNCRQHNIDLVPLTSICLGYNAFDMLLAAYVSRLPTTTTTTTDDTSTIPTIHDDENHHDRKLVWDDIPSLPTKRLHGAVVHLVCHVTGRVMSIRHMEEISTMESVAQLEIYEGFHEGRVVSPTIDIKTDAGWIHLIHDDEKQLKRDYERIVELMPTMFEVEDGEGKVGDSVSFECLRFDDD